MESRGNKQTSVVLIVDDQESVRDILAGLLAGQGYNLAFATTGSEALTKAVELTPHLDLVVLDIMMPGLNGFEVCRQLRAHPLLAEIPVIMVTALKSHQSMLEGLEAGADDFIAKPFDYAELRARVRTLTRLNQHRRLRTTELRLERDRTRAILEAVGEAVFVTDIYGTIEYLNQAGTTLTGYTAEELLGQDWRVWWPDQKRLQTKIMPFVEAGHTWRGEATHRHKDGMFYDVMLTIAPLLDPDSAAQIIGFVSVHRNITELKEAQHTKDKFISNVSHELRTPLSVITLLCDNLDELYDQLTHTKRRKMIRDMQTQTQILDNLVNDVLEIARLDSGRMSTRREQVNLTTLSQQKASDLQTMAHEKNQTLVCKQGGLVVVWGNRRQLEQVIRNLIDNAIKYTPVGGTISCECQLLHIAATSEFIPDWPGTNKLTPGRWAAFRVVDNGIGIDPHHFDVLFDRFFRVNEQQQPRGTGLGLSIAKETVELHGGHITVEAQPGAGSTFAFYLPQYQTE